MINEKEKWDCVLGLLQVDGLKPSEEMMEMIEKEKKGEMSMDEIKDALYAKYGIEHKS